MIADPVHQRPIPSRAAAWTPRRRRHLLRAVGAAPQQCRLLGKYCLAALHQEDEQGEERNEVATKGHGNGQSEGTNKPNVVLVHR